jgi:hypothetical protein
MNEKTKTSKNFNILEALEDKLESESRGKLRGKFESFVLLVELQV